MPEIIRSALLPYPALYMYELVNRVEAYPEFLPWCGGARIIEQDEISMQAAIQISGAGLNQWFTTRNRMVPGESIAMSLVEGPFQRLEGRWTFTPIENEGCKIELVLQFEFKRGLASALIAPAFTRIANSMVESFCGRARELHERQDQH